MTSTSTALDRPKPPPTGREAFASATFNVDRYLQCRPRYPSHLYALIQDYVSRGKSSAGGILCDLGCGPGFASFPLFATGRFDELVGIDTGKGMIEIAPAALQAWAKTTGNQDIVSSKQSRFVVGDSANLTGVLEDHTVSLVIAATAAHWFDHAKTWRELTRVVRPGGAVLYWTYGENYLPGHPGLQGDIFNFMQADGIGPYFSQPGRSLLTNLLKDIPLPHDAALLGDEALPQDLVDQWDPSSVLYEKHPLEADGIADTSWIASSSKPPHRVDLRQPFRLEQVMTWTDYEGYIRTASALHSYLKAHPEEQEGEGDIADRFIKKLRSKVAEERSRGIGTEEGLPDDRVRVAWPLGIKGIRKKPA